MNFTVEHQVGGEKDRGGAPGVESTNTFVVSRPDFLAHLGSGEAQLLSNEGVLFRTERDPSNMMVHRSLRPARYSHYFWKRVIASSERDALIAE